VLLMLWVLWMLLMRHENSRCRCHVLVMRRSLGMLGILRCLLHRVLTTIVHWLWLLARDGREGIYWSSMDVVLWRTNGCWRV
jgi:hypothetical protein